MRISKCIMSKVYWLFAMFSTKGDLMLFRARATLSSHCLPLGLLLVTKLLEMLLSSILGLEDWGKHLSSTWPNYKGLRFWISIHSWYGLDKVVEMMDNSLDVFFKHSGVLSLIGAIMMFSSMLRVEHRFECIELLVMDEKCIFAKSLMGTTIYNSGIRKRSDELYNSFILFLFLF